MFVLIAAILGLCVGPLLFGLLHRSEKPQLVVDGFVLVAVVGLVMLHVLPEAVDVAGVWALVAAGIGLVLPLLAEKIRAMSHDASHGIVLAVAFVGLTLHASLDGVGLASSDGLALAVVLHRIPVGLGVWWLVRPQFGRRWAIAVLAVLCVATVVGWSMQAAIVAPGGIVWIQVVQALVAGSLLHVILHQSIGFHDHAHAATGWRWPGTIGAVAAIMLVGLLPDAHHHTLGEHVIDLLLVTAPYLLVAAIMGAVGAAASRRNGLVLLDRLAPWAVAMLLVGAMVTHVHAEPSVFNVAASIVFALLVLVSIAHQGPRDFLLVVLPLDAGRHDHSEPHAHTHAVAEVQP